MLPTEEEEEEEINDNEVGGSSSNQRHLNDIMAQVDWDTEDAELQALADAAAAAQQQQHQQQDYQEENPNAPSSASQQQPTRVPLSSFLSKEKRQKPVHQILETPQPSSASGMKFEELYRLKGVLGTGAFSTVREGFHRSDNSFGYAVKCINRKKLSEEDEAALLDEVSILKEMKHVHIIRLFDFFEEPSTYYLVMERMRGGELFDRIVAKAYYNEKEARDTCRIMLGAMAYCHDHHVAHRDLKPENLLLLYEHDDSAVKIADFGFAKRVYQKKSLKTQCGTPGYVAPEILEGNLYDERADNWSVGVILYILLGGYPPFIESTQRDLFRKIRKGEYEFHEEYWGTVSHDAKSLISSLLTVDADLRLTAVEALQSDWMMDDDQTLAERDLGGNLIKLRNFNAKRKFRAAVASIIAVNKLNSIMTFGNSNTNANLFRSSFGSHDGQVNAAIQDLS
jgi:calcium/calmodulin-dependent protein kinase I